MTSTGSSAAVSVTGASDTGAALGEGRGTGAVWLGDGSDTTAVGVGETLGGSWDGAVSLGDRLGETPDWTWLGDGSLGGTPGGNGPVCPRCRRRAAPGRAAGEADVFSRNPWKNPPFLCFSIGTAGGEEGRNGANQGTPKKRRESRPGSGQEQKSAG